MRIALFSECYLPVTNGVVTSILTLRETLRERGHSVLVFAPGTPQPEDDDDIFRLPELPFPRHPYHFARPFPKLSVDFSDLNVDIIHCQHPFTVGRLGADMAKRYDLPMVYTAHSLYNVMMATAKSPIVRELGQKAALGVMQRFCAKADYVIAPSQHTRDSLNAEGVRARFAVVPSSILWPDSRPGAREYLRSQIGVKADTPLLLYVGRVAPEKRIELLLYAVQKLKKRSLPAPACDFRVAIVGDGQSRQDLEELSVALGVQDRVLFLGSQPHENIGDWYAIGDIFTLTSPVETQGLVILEAMAAGLPCVTVDGGGACEMVAPDETGIVVHFDPQEYADALEQLLKDPTRSLLMGERGKERARLYSPEAMATGVLEVYEAALRLPRPTAFGNHSPKSPTDIIKRQLKAKARRDRLTRQTPKR